MNSLYEYCIIDGGIVGVATVMKLIESDPGVRVFASGKGGKTRFASNEP